MLITPGLQNGVDLGGVVVVHDILHALGLQSGDHFGVLVDGGQICKGAGLVGVVRATRANPGDLRHGLVVRSCAVRRAGGESVACVFVHFLEFCRVTCCVTNQILKFALCCFVLLIFDFLPSSSAKATERLNAKLAAFSAAACLPTSCVAILFGIVLQKR